MSWVERMATASFRGFDFLTDAHDSKGGRRLAIHELPGAEEPNVQDLGGKAGNFSLNAYFIGEDYDLERNGFLLKLAEPGATWLTHPWLGLLWVRAHNWHVHESNDKGGMCTIVIEFVPGGSAPYVPAVDYVDAAIDKTYIYQAAAMDDFSLAEMSANSMTAFVAGIQNRLETLRKWISLTRLPLTYVSQLMGLVNSFKEDLAVLLATPKDYANALNSLANVFGAGSADLDNAGRQRLIARLVKPAAGISTVNLAGANSAALRLNIQRDLALNNRLFIAAAAQLALADYDSANQRDLALGTVTAALNGLLPTMPDSVFQPALDVRVSLQDALLAQDLEPLSQRSIAKAMPAAVLAYRMGVSESRLLAQNDVIHPLFVRGKIYG